MTVAVPPYVIDWMEFLKTVEIKGPIPATFKIFQSAPPNPQWILQSTMVVPNRDSSHPCDYCKRTYQDQNVIFQNVLPGPDCELAKEQVILQRVLAMYHHEALESIYINDSRHWDPHKDHFYSNLISNWRMYP